MAEKIIFTIFLVCAVAWQSQAQSQAAVTCTVAGRFAVTSDTTCKNYTLCVYSSTTNTYTGYNYQCPSTSLFSPTLSLCTTNYVCTGTSTTNTTSSSVCTADGYFADSNSSDCSSYIECVQINGSYTATTYTCPAGTYFDPNTTLCESDYNCTSTFTCTSAGRFANSSDTTCQTYYYCVALSNGSFVEYDYTCPSTSVFNPNTSMCTTSYTCTNT